MYIYILIYIYTYIHIVTHIHKYIHMGLSQKRVIIPKVPCRQER
jgi:hypothetical protein